MKRILIAGALALASGSYAFAADLPPPIAPPPRAPATYVPMAAPAYNWSGFYLGVNGGYGVGDSRWTVGRFTSGNFDTSGFLVGGTAGANAQWGEFVLGVETDLDYSTIKGTTPATFCIVCQTRNDWLGTARGRVGFALDRVLFYGTGGAAYGDIRPMVFGLSDSQTKVGWTAGAGVEGAFADNWTAKIEYLYADLGTASCTTACGGAPPGAIPVTLRENLIRAGLNYKFNF
jgi:outer membrane immunogenic protein